MVRSAGSGRRALRRRLLGPRYHPSAARVFPVRFFRPRSVTASGSVRCSRIREPSFRPHRPTAGRRTPGPYVAITGYSGRWLSI